MTWLRLDTTFPRHELIGSLAEALRIDPDRAGMVLIRIWCAVAEYAPSGQLGEITDTTLEDWALWRGKRGALGAAFRQHCLETDGKVKGWWRQEKLLAHQLEKRRRPGPAERAKGATMSGNQNGNMRQPTGAGSGEIPPGESAGNDDSNGNVVLQSVSQGPVSARLIQALGRDPDRFAVTALFEHLPPDRDMEAWAGLLLQCLQGGLAQGRAATVGELAAACAEYPAIEHCPWSPAHFRAAVDRVVRKRRQPSPVTGRAERAIDTAKAWVTAEPAA